MCLFISIRHPLRVANAPEGAVGNARVGHADGEAHAFGVLDGADAADLPGPEPGRGLADAAHLPQPELGPRDGRLRPRPAR
eukprot:109380-Rhodomonas_salina.1